ncbi:hypothetical protein SAMN02745126_05053 [Enhydrobacter aerosaccus]|uniref:Uncharacterized protein n=1 Tax=Enhydrobacter aerosaccus TaxID=225324 RepID=A0A1T4SS14_9HYPH|nr:hypothetical protein SAMN02745126_05053 [Enhydrobacter aerosaccus]
MHNFLFRCPATGLMIQGSIEQVDPSTRFVPQDCPVCGGIHLVDPRTGERPQDEAKGDSDC